jgi:hypothetical protein
VLLVEIHRLLNGLDGLLRAGEVPYVHLLALEHLAVLREALQLDQPVLGEFVEVLVGHVLRFVEVDADDLLVVLMPRRAKQGKMVIMKQDVAHR